MKLRRGKKCYYCGYVFGILESYYILKKAIKPPGKPNRYKTIGKVCVLCSEKKSCTIDSWKKN